MRELHEKVSAGILLRVGLMFTLVMVLFSWVARFLRAEDLMLFTSQEAVQLRLNSSE